MKPILLITIKYSLLLFAAFVLIWWTLFLSPFNILRYIPYTPIKLYGLLLCTSVFTVLLFAQKELLRKDIAITLVKMILIGTAICFINEVFFQFVLNVQSEVAHELYGFIKGVTTMSIMGAILSFFVAYQLKTKHTDRLLLFIVVFFGLLKVLFLLFPVLSQS